MVVVKAVASMVVVDMVASNIIADDRWSKAKSYGEKNPNQAWMNMMLDGIVAEQDGVIAIRDFAAMVVAVMTVGSVE